MESTPMSFPRSARFLLFQSLLLAGLAIACIAFWKTGNDGTTTLSKPLSVIVHINFGDAGRQQHGLKNVENILKAAAAAGIKTQVEVVCHSDGITLLEKAKTAEATRIEALQKKGVYFAACENTMRQRSIRPDDLLQGVKSVPSGAFEIVARQQDGYSYFKP